MTPPEHSDDDPETDAVSQPVRLREVADDDGDDEYEPF